MLDRMDCLKPARRSAIGEDAPEHFLPSLGQILELGIALSKTSK